MEEITILLEDLARDAQTTKRRAAVLARLEALAGDVEALAAGERARRARALVVVILARAAPRLRGCDVVEAVGAGRAGEALVDAHAFLSRDANPVVERWAAALLDATLPGAYAQHIGFDDAAPMAERVRDFSAKVNAVAAGLLREDLLRDFFAAAPPPGDAATASLLGVLANVFAFASRFQAKLRQKLARDGDVARDVALPLLRRCCAGAARGAEPAARRRHWGRLLLSLRLLVVATFKLKAARKAVCDDDPTAAVLAVVDDDAADDDDRLSFSLSQDGTVTQKAKLKMTTPSTSHDFGPTAATAPSPSVNPKDPRKIAQSTMSRTKENFCASMFSRSDTKPSGASVAAENT